MAKIHPIRKYCRKLGITQRQFALTVGFTEGFVSQLINGHEKCGRDAAMNIEQATGKEITVGDLFKFEKKHNSAA